MLNFLAVLKCAKMLHSLDPKTLWEKCRKLTSCNMRQNRCVIIISTCCYSDATKNGLFRNLFRDFCSLYYIYVLVILLCSIFSTFGVYGGEKAAHTTGKYSLKARGKKEIGKVKLPVPVLFSVEVYFNSNHRLLPCNPRPQRQRLDNVNSFH